MNKYSKSTVVVHYGLNTDYQHGCVVPPIYLSSMYSFQSFKQPRKYDYARKKNPTRDIVQDVISSLEHGLGAIITNSGMSAIYLLLTTFLQPGELILCPNDCYGGSYRLFKSLMIKKMYKVQFINMSCKNTFLLALKQKPKLVFIESPSNPLLKVVDLSYYCAVINDIGAISVVDNTLLSPVFQNPLNLGANLVVHSCTKYINGHSDVIAGAIITKNNNMLDKLLWWGNNIGVTSSVLNDYLLIRGVRTLYIRLQKAQDNTLHILKYLKTQELVKNIYYPSLNTNIGHIFAKKQQTGYGAILSFEFNGSMQMLKNFLNKLTLFTLAESMGGVESLISHPASMTHVCMSTKEITVAGITDALLRLSVGIEDYQDLIADLDQAFKQCY